MLRRRTATQTWPTSNGTGSLEASRGSDHVVDGNGNALTGEQDIFGNAVNTDGAGRSRGERLRLERRDLQRLVVVRILLVGIVVVRVLVVRRRRGPVASWSGSSWSGAFMVRVLVVRELMVRLVLVGLQLVRATTGARSATFARPAGRHRCATSMRAPPIALLPLGNRAGTASSARSHVGQHSA